MIPITIVRNPLAIPHDAAETNANNALLYAGICIPFTAVALSASGSVVADIAAIAVPFARYVPLALVVVGVGAAGTLAVATLDLRTATAGAGASLLTAPTAINSVTATGKIQTIVPVATDVRTAATLSLRQTVDSANAGSISGVLIVRPLP